MNNNITFTQRYSFIDNNKFNSLARGVLFDCYPYETCAQKAEILQTWLIKSCTGGGLVNTKTKEAVGFHYLDIFENFNRIEKFVDKLFNMVKNPDRCLIIGGKDIAGSPYSMKSLQKFIDILTKRVENVTIFGGQQQHAQSSIHYSVFTDEWNILAEEGNPYRRARIYDPLLNPNELKEYFKIIKVADGDTLLINGQEIDIKQL